MDAETRNAIHAEAKAESLETLGRLADLKVEYRNHDDDGHLTSWSRTMPPRPKPVPSPTIAEVEAKIADAMEDIDDRIAAAFKSREWQHEATLEAIGQALGETRKKLRAEFEEQLGQLRAELTVTKTAAGDRGEVIDLPALPLRSRHA